MNKHRALTVVTIISAALIALGGVFGVQGQVFAQSVGFSVGYNNPLVLTSANENLIYGLMSASSTAGSFLKLQKFTAPSTFQDIFAIDYQGNITTTGTLTGANSVWQTNGNNIYNSNTGNVGIGTTNPGSYKLNVTGNQYVSGYLSSPNILSGIVYAESATLTRALNEPAGWVKIWDSGGGSVYTTNFRITGGYNNRYNNLEFRVTTSGYGQPHSIVMLPTTNYNQGTIEEIRTQDVSNTQLEVWVKVSAVESLYAGNITVYASDTGLVNPLSLTTTQPTWGVKSVAVYPQQDMGNLPMQLSSSIRSFGAGSNYFAGNVGVGTNAPGQKLDVGASTSDYIRSFGGFVGSSAANIGGTGAAAYFPSGVYIAGSTSWIYGTVNFNSIIKDNQATPRWSINPTGSSWFNGGNIGIGTTTPATKLYINGGTVNVLNVGGGFIAGLNSTPVNTDQAVPLGYIQSNYVPLGSGSGGVGSGTSGQTLRHNGTSWVANSILVNNGTNVGVGATNPAYKLDVSGNLRVTAGSSVAALLNSTADAQLTLQSSDTWTGIAFDDSGATNDYIWYGGTNGTFAIGGGGANVSGKKLHVDGGMSIGANSDSSAVPTNGLYVEGNVGIGTTAPIQKLDVNGAIGVRGVIASTAGEGLYLGYNNNVGTITSANIGTGGKQLDIGGLPIRFINSNSGAEFARIDTSGNIGISSTNPGAKLEIVDSKSHVSGDLSGTDAILRLYNSYGSDVAEKGATLTFEDNYLGTNRTTRAAIKGGTATAGNTANGFLSFYTDAGSANSMQERMRVDYSGNVGIGITNPSTKLHISGGTVNVLNVGGGFVAGLNSTPVNADQAVPLGYLQANYSSTSNQLWSGVLNGNIWNGTAGAGNVGIGNNAPAQKLDVTGVITASTGFRVNNAVATAGQYLRGNGTNFVASTIQVSDVPTLNQNTTGYATLLHYEDNRTISPSELATNKLKFGFTAYNNNNAAPWADFLHLRSYHDSSGGNDNLLVFNKSAIGMRLYQQTYGSATAYASYKDVLMSDNSPTVNYLTKYTVAGTSVSVGKSLVYDNGTNVGIGTTSPITKLAVSGGTTNVINVGGGFVAGLNSTPVSADQAVPLGYLQSNYTPITGGGYYPLTGGNLDGPIYMNATTDVNRNISNVNTLSANKLNVNVIDPLYRIKGVNYSTYASSIVGGLKEEYLGRIKVASRNTEGDYQAILDFDKVEEGSDAWVWRQVVDFAPQNIEASLTPYGGFAQVYYAVGDNSIIFHADRPVEVSYRLVGKRFDWRLWPTLSDDQDSAGYPVK